MTGVAGVIVPASVRVPMPPALVALRVTVEAPAVVGVPEMRPVVALSARPAGNPVAPKLVGLLVAVIGKLNATPTWPVAVPALVMTGVAGVIVTASVWVPVPPALVALRVTVEAPAVVGVPEMRPVVALSARPAGNPVAPKLVGLLVAVIGELNATPTWPVAVPALVMTGVAGVIVTVSVWVPVPPALVALRATVEAPALVGVPAMSPLVALSARPAGNPVASKLVGLLVAGLLT